MAGRCISVLANILFSFQLMFLKKGTKPIRLKEEEIFPEMISLREIIEGKEKEEEEEKPKMTKGEADLALFVNASIAKEQSDRLKAHRERVAVLNAKKEADKCQKV